MKPRKDSNTKKTQKLSISQLLKKCRPLSVRVKREDFSNFFNPVIVKAECLREIETPMVMTEWDCNQKYTPQESAKAYETDVILKTDTVVIKMETEEMDTEEEDEEPTLIQVNKPIYTDDIIDFEENIQPHTIYQAAFVPPQKPAAAAPESAIFCNVYGCLSNTRAYPDYHFFLLPTDTYRCKQWLKRVEREDLLARRDRVRNKFYFCETHFLSTDIITTRTGKILKRTALPILNPMRQFSKSLNPKFKSVSLQAMTPVTENYTQTAIATVADASNQVNFETASDYRKKISNELNAARRNLNQNKKGAKGQFHNDCDHFLNNFVAEIVRNQCVMPTQQGKRYKQEYKIFSLGLLFTSRKVYRMLQKDFSLPNPTSKTIFSNMPITTDSKTLLAALEIKVKSMTEREKYCTVAVDMTRLKPNLFYNSRIDRIVGLHEIDGRPQPMPASHALLVVVRGLLVDWMQPIGFALLSDTDRCSDTTPWIYKMLRNLLKIGLKVKAYTPVSGSDLLNKVDLENLSKEQPYFCVDDNIIYYLYNVPDLIQDLITCFFNNDFHYKTTNYTESGVAKFSHLVEFYNQDSGDFRLAPDLTDNHIYYLDCDVETKLVKYAAEIFSKTVATGLNTYIDFGVIEQSAQDTVQFLLLINDLCDLINSPSSTLFTSNDSQKELLNTSMSLFESLKVSRASSSSSECQLTTNGLEFVTKFVITISSFVKLIDEPKLEGYDGFLPSRLNLDVMEKIFDTMRVRGAMTMDLTSHQFVMYFRKMYLARILEPLEKSKIDFKELMTSLLQQDDGANVDGSSSSESFHLGIFEQRKNHIPNTILNELPIADDYTKKEICSFLLKRCVNFHKNCDKIQKFYQKYRYIMYQTFGSSGEREQDREVKMFEDYVEMMEQEFHKMFSSTELPGKVGLALFENVQAIPQRVTPPSTVMPCSCFPTEFLQLLFLRWRIHSTVRSNNTIYRKRKNQRIPNFVLPTICP